MHYLQHTSYDSNSVGRWYPTELVSSSSGIRGCISLPVPAGVLPGGYMVRYFFGESTELADCESEPALVGEAGNGGDGDSRM